MDALPRTLLRGLRVLDRSTSVAGRWCGRLLADAGADVVRPAQAGGPGTGSGFLDSHLDAGKRPPQPAPGAWDVLLHDPDDAPAVPDETITCSVADFPPGPYAGWLGGELVQQALSGTMAITGRATERPLYGVGRRAAYAAGTTAFSAVLAAVVERAATGTGQAVGTTVFESTAAMAQNLVSQHSYNGTGPTRERYPGLLAVLEASDGWVVVFLLAGWDEVCEVFGAEDLRTDPRFAQPAARFRHWAEALERFAVLARRHTCDELVSRAQRRRISMERVTDLASLVRSPQWQARGFVGQGRPPRLGPAFRVVHEAPRATRVAPRPLAGRLVVDLTTAWAGPFATRGLAHLGLEVVKVESPHRLDSWRAAFGGGATERYPDHEPGDRPWDRNVLFNTQSQGKRSLGLDLKAPGAVELVLSLVARADAVVSNFPPGTMSRLGLGPDVLLGAQPRLVVVEMPAYGSGGPVSHHVGMGKTMEAACGMASLLGYGDGRPVLTGPAVLDPIGGLHGTAAVLAGLAHVARGGAGCVIEVPQTEAAALWIGEHLLAALAGCVPTAPNGNDVPDAFPHDAFPCAGQDEWVAIAVTDETWPALCVVLDRPDLAGSALRHVQARRHERETVEAAVRAWTACLDKRVAAVRLQGAGIAAAPVLHPAEVATDPALRAAGLVRSLTHPAAGTHDYPQLAYRLSRTATGVHRAAPCFGADNDAVLRDLLGLGTEEVAALRAAGVVHDRPSEQAVAVGG